MRVLIAEDEPLNRRILEATLARWGHEIEVATDGMEAWEALQREDAPRMAILDWMMPGIDGIEVCRRLRERKQGPYVYVILLTSKNRKEDALHALDGGVDDFLTKPLDPNELQVHLRAGARIVDLQTRLLSSLEEVNRTQAQLASARQREGEIGGRIQQALLLGQPPQESSSWQVAVLSNPSQHIDGDFYDFYNHSRYCMDVLVGDVMGKGVPAALLGAAAKTQFLRALGYLSSQSGPGQLPLPEQILAQVYRQVSHQFIRLERYITLIYARFDLHDCRVDLVDCGHTMTLHYHVSTGKVDTIQGSNMPLGFGEEEYVRVTRTFQPGDLFFFYSDGVTEARGPDRELFGAQRLIDLIQKNGSRHPQDVISTVQAAVIAYSGADTFSDDLTCVAIKIGSNGCLASARMVTTSDLKELAQIREFIRSFCEEHAALDTDSVRQLSLAASEAAANIVKHAYRSRPGLPIDVEIEQFSDRVGLRFLHKGEPLDPSVVKPPSFDGSREGGFGIYFISQYVDEIRHGTADDGRVSVYLVKRRRTRRGGKKHGTDAGERR